jgi:hypothetical protein
MVTFFKFSQKISLHDLQPPFFFLEKQQLLAQHMNGLKIVSEIGHK